MAYCDDPITDSWNDTLRAYFCGINAAFTAPASGVVTGAQDTIGGLGDSAAMVVVNGQDTIAHVADDAKDAANPLNLFGFGAGLGVSALATAVGVGLVGAFAADQLFAGGAGTNLLIARIRSRR